MPRIACSPRVLHVLVADDDRLSQRHLAGLIEGLGHTVTLVPSGDDAVLAAMRGGFDLALMDLGMLGLDGLAATAAIRQSEGGGERLPIVALTAGEAYVDRDRCRIAGMDRYLTKPVTRRSLAATLAWANARASASLLESICA